MSFLKQILKPFVVFDEDVKTPPAKESQLAPILPKAVPVAPAMPMAEANAQHPLITGSKPIAPAANQTPTHPSGGPIVRALPEHVQYFERLIEDANARNPLFQGADYKEFVDSKVDIDDITDEAIKYKTAFNILKGTGLTKEKILSTGQEYLNLIGRDLNAFQSAHAQQYQKELGSKEAEIQKKAEQLLALTQQVNALKKDINDLTQDISLTKDQLNKTKNSFLLAGENKQNEIVTELQKINQYF
jgi:hypothetical protein